MLELFTPGAEIVVQGYVANIQNRVTPKGTEVCNISVSVGNDSKKQWYDLSVWKNVEEIKQGDRIVAKGQPYSGARYRKMPETPMTTTSEAFKAWMTQNPPNSSIKVNVRAISLLKDGEELPIDIK